MRVVMNGFVNLIKKNANGSIISSKEAYRRMKSSDKYVLLDVRTASEYAEVRIEGAVLIPVDSLEVCAPMELPDKNVPIYVYCHAGVRASKAVDFLKGMGYTNVLSFGGVVNWPYDTVSG